MKNSTYTALFALWALVIASFCAIVIFAWLD